MKQRVVQKWQAKLSLRLQVWYEMHVEMSQHEIVEDVMVDRIVVNDRPGTSHGSIPVKNTFASLDKEDSEIVKVDVDTIVSNEVDGSDSSSGVQSSKNGETKKKSEQSKIR
ncbi:hypothetical protein LIER_08964 [Lithospermum erythrorhizon]|uniref:Uncharacterized protein n=1 Tax=Lithospermum erythrorhizon TaxID=34254 RepID=A0AAV3PFM1_LITER